MACQLVWCGQCYENRRQKANHRGHRGYRAVRYRYFDLEMFMRKPEKSEGAMSVGVGLLEDERMQAEYPCLYAHMTDVTWDDGSKRETTTVLLCVDTGTLKAWVNDRALSRSAWVSASSLDGLLGAIERGLGGDCLEWRPTIVRNGKFQGKRA